MFLDEVFVMFPIKNKANYAKMAPNRPQMSSRQQESITELFVYGKNRK